LIEQFAYLNDPLKLEFTARIIDKVKSKDDHCDVILEKTYFYPTGGGQAHDTGTLGEARVVDVFKDEAGRVVHRLDREITGSTVPAKIDAERRLGHMQHHSAQHMLSAALKDVLKLDSLSARISGTTPSTVDVPLRDLDQADFDRVERFVNQIIFENRPIKSYFITEDQIPAIPFRWPPKVTGQIRVVEVEAFDYTACGGTHCLQTGMIGLIKILKTERINQKLRLHFAAGQQALQYFQVDHRLVAELSRYLSTGPEELPALVQQQIEQLRAAQKEIDRLGTDLLSFEAKSLVEQAEPFDTGRLILATFIDRAPQILRELGKLLQQESRIIAVLAGYTGQKLSVVVSCADDAGLSARALLAQQLEPLGGRGGGDDRLAQGSGPATERQVETFFDHIHASIRAVQEEP
jgi:alanyl-tRNA synthetase